MIWCTFNNTFLFFLVIMMHKEFWMFLVKFSVLRTSQKDRSERVDLVASEIKENNETQT